MKFRINKALSVLGMFAVAVALTSAVHAGESKKKKKPEPPSLKTGHVNQDQVPIPPWSHVNQDDTGGPPGGRGQSPPSGQGWSPPRWMPYPFNVFRVFFLMPQLDEQQPQKPARR